MSKTTSMQDIATKLSISINAVSIALNDKEGVSNDLRIQILETAVDLGYPSKKLNTKDTLKSKTLAIMIEDKKKNDAYYLDLLKHLKKEAKLFGYRILDEYYNINQFIVPESISEHHVVGVIVLGKINAEVVYSLKLYIQEVLYINHSLSHFNINNIITNDFLGGYISCEYLIKKGYKRIGFVGEIDSSKNFKSRFQGYRQCLFNYFQPKKHEFVCITQGIEKAVLDNNYQYIQKMLLTYREMPEAFVCVNDRNAVIVIKALQYNGYKVPQDIKVIGFDNMDFCNTMAPSLSSLEVKGTTIAKKAIRRMIEIIREDTLPEVTMLSPQVIERKSTQ